MPCVRQHHSHPPMCVGDGGSSTQLADEATEALRGEEPGLSPGAPCAEASAP